LKRLGRKFGHRSERNLAIVIERARIVLFVHKDADSSPLGTRTGLVTKLIPILYSLITVHCPSHSFSFQPPCSFQSNTLR
jgi:hypothetical protein